jgi:hypothetical protein
MDDDLTYWTEKLRQAEQELDAARTRTAVNEAAKKLQYAKAQLRALEEMPAGPAKPSRGRASGAAAS